MKAADIQKANRLMLDNERLDLLLKKLREMENAAVVLSSGPETLITLRAMVVYDLLQTLREQNATELVKLGVKP